MMITTKPTIQNTTKSTKKTLSLKVLKKSIVNKINKQPLINLKSIVGYKRINFLRVLKITKAIQAKINKTPLYNYFSSAFDFIMLNKYGNTINYKLSPYDFNVSTSCEIAVKIDSNKSEVKTLNAENKQLSSKLVKIIAEDYNKIKLSNPDFNRVEIISKLRGLYKGKNKSYEIITDFKALNVQFNSTYSIAKLAYILTLLSENRVTKSAYKKLNSAGVDKLVADCKVEDKLASSEEYIVEHA